jgi:putative aldouronate transport system permease protein
MKSLRKENRFVYAIKKYWILFLMLLPGIFHYILFRYVPMGGLVAAFQKLNLFGSIFNSDWVGLANFRKLFFESSEFWKAAKNTLLLGFYTLIWSMPVPVIFAIILSELKAKRLKKFVQSVSFAPSMLSVVVICSMFIDFLSPTGGIINRLLISLGLESHYFMIDPKWFRTIYISSGIWQTFGYNAVIYFAAITAIEQDLYEAAQIDGCSRIKRIWHVTLPQLLPTICIMTVLNAGNIFKIGPDKALLLYNPMTYETGDILGTYVYRMGIINSNYSIATAAGLFESIIAFVMILTANKVSKKLTDNSLW